MTLRSVRAALVYATAIAAVVGTAFDTPLGAGPRASTSTPVQTSAVPQRSRPATGTASISGRVITADTGTSVRSATVTLILPVGSRWTATTDGEGRFRIPELPSGRFSLRIAKAGFVSGPSGPDPRPAGTFELLDGQHLDLGDLRLRRGGVITGRVIDEFGEPIVDAYVSALRSEYTEPGVRRLSAAASAQTNDLGEYRLHSLAPGKYYVSTGLRTMQISGGTNAPSQQFVGASRGSAPTFYPGTATASDAQPVTVVAGETTPNTDVRLLGVPLARLSGTVVDSRGQPAPRMAVMLNPARLDGALLPMQANVFESDSQGRFTLSNVAPGEYRLDVEPVARIEAIGRTGASGRRGEMDEFASQPISVTGEDIRDIVVQTGRGFRVSGRVQIEGGSLTADVLQRMSVNVYPLLPGQGISSVLQTAGAFLQPDASFTVSGVTGPRLIRVTGLPAGHVLKAVRAYGTDVTDAGIDVLQDLAGVEIVITARPTKIIGTVTDAAGIAATEYGVIIFSDDSRRWVARMNRFVTALRPGPDGRFAVTGLPAGGYLAVAVDAIDEGAWAAPENLERLRAVAASFTLGEGEARTLTLVKRTPGLERSAALIRTTRDPVGKKLCGVY